MRKKELKIEEIVKRTRIRKPDLGVTQGRYTWSNPVRLSNITVSDFLEDLNKTFNVRFGIFSPNPFGQFYKTHCTPIRATSMREVLNYSTTKYRQTKDKECLSST